MKKYIKKLSYIFILLLIFSLSILANKLEIKKDYIDASSITSQLLEIRAYDKKEMSEELSEKMFNNYIKSLDPAKMYFTREDIKGFSEFSKIYGYMADDVRLKLGFDIYELYIERLTNQYNRIINKLKNEKINLYTKDEYILDREKEEFPKDLNELNQLWDKKLINDYIRLKINNETDEKIKEILIKRYENNLKNSMKYTSDEVASLVINSYTTTIDPHNSWMSPDEANEFKVSNSLSLVGIGVSLQQRGEENVVREIIKGGPADKSGQFMIGDRIVAVGQGEDGELEDTSTYRLKDLVKIVRGELGTVVRIGLRSSEDSPMRVVKLVREKIKQEDQEVSYKIIDIQRDGKTRKVGYILVPGFYSKAFSDDTQIGKSVSEDVRDALVYFNRNNVESLVVDLRNNGGGSLSEVLDMAGLFIGPNQVVVQVRNSNGDVGKLKSGNVRQIWYKPVVVMTNKYSASASEIFAGAMQDYNRAVIVGENTWGKGSVQTVTDVLDVLRDKTGYSDNLGMFKYTIQMFFRPNGESTQIKGVKPDIEFPTNHLSDNYGEFKYENALSYRTVPKASYKQFDDFVSLDIIKNKHQKRVQKSKEWNLLKEQKEYEGKYLKNDKISLNLDERLKDRELKLEKQEYFKKESEKLNLPTSKIFEIDNGLSYNEEDISKQLEKEKELKNIVDTETYEACEISLDLIKK